MASPHDATALDMRPLSLDDDDDNSNMRPPPPPSGLSSGIVAVDIKDKFTRAVQTLEPGEVVKDGFFSLFEAVAALEIMDPKMDSGCIEPGEEFDELYDVSRPLQLEEVLGIMDKLLCLEMSWHSGYPLSQTVLTSVYCEALLMPNPSKISEATFVRPQSPGNPELDILRAYCLGMLKTCFFVNERIKFEHFYEEEDFVSNTYHRDLLQDLPIQDVQREIKQAIDMLKTLDSNKKPDLLDALRVRLILRSSFLEAAYLPDESEPINTSHQPWESALQVLPPIKTTHDLAKPVAEAFSEKLQRKLASTMPPRPIVELEFIEAFKQLERLFRNGLQALSALDYTDPQCLMTFVSTFQAMKPQPPIFVRTILQHILFSNMRVLQTKSIRQILDEDFAIVSMPASALLDRSNDDVEATQDPRFTMAQQMELFRERAAQPYLDVLRTFCQNRSRVRRTLCHVIRTWDSLQVDAEDIDHIIQVRASESRSSSRAAATPTLRNPDAHAYPLGSWVYLYKLKLMELIVQMGFELQVYQPDELAGMYWYLNYLAKFRVRHVERIKSFLQQKTGSVQNDDTNAGGDDNEDDKQLRKSFLFLRLTMLDAAVTWELSDAVFLIYAILLRHHIIVPPPRPYSDDSLRYSLRMKPFATVGLPALPSFEESRLGVEQSDVPTPELIEYAETCIASAKPRFDVLRRMDAAESFSIGSHELWMGSVKNAHKACIAAGVTLAALKKASEAAGEGGEWRIKAEVPGPDKSYHDWWVIPSIVPA